jgi:endonuclease/exonuclease/phosphatase family metal-dependent hydrolase
MCAEIHDPLKEYISEHAASTDIFCFQESSPALVALCNELLPNYTHTTAEKHRSEHDSFDQLTLTRPGIQILETKEVIAEQPFSGLGLYTKVQLETETYHLLNVHGVAQPGDKLDNPVRLEQTDGILKFMDALDGKKIIGGDFNLLPVTDSVKRFAINGYCDLISEFGITTTRNKIAWGQHPGNEQYFADYIFTKSLTETISLHVPQIEVSDHLPLELVLN